MIAYLAASVTAMAASFLLGGLVGGVPLPGAVGLSAAGAILVGIRRHRPVPARPWYLFAAAQMAFAGGDVVRHSLHRAGAGGGLPVVEVSSAALALLVVARLRWLVEALGDARSLAILEAAPDPMLAVDAEGAIRWVNGRLEELFGYGRGELLGEPVERLVPDEHRGPHREARDAYRHAPPRRVMGVGPQIWARRRDGTTFPVDITLSSIDTVAGPLVAAAVRDVTERVRAKEQLARSQAEQKRLADQVQQVMRLDSLGHLAGGVAHDFNNLLAVIVNHADFALGGLPERGEDGSGDGLEQVRDDLGHVLRACESATSLVRQLLIFARRNSSRARVLDLNDVVERIESLLRRTVSEDIRLHVRLAEGPLLIEADRANLEQVILNLAGNASDAMPGGGDLTLQTEAVVDIVGPPADSGPGARLVRLTVTDTGVGMTPEVAARVFDPFFSTKDEQHGTGLGLATVYGIVSRAGGQVTLESPPAAGTTVIVDLPAAVAAPEASSSAAPLGDRAPAAGTILLAEDNPAVRRVARRALLEAGYEVITAGSADEAVRRFETAPHAVDLLLTDVVMPRVSGPDLAASLHLLRPGLPVLFMSGYPRDHVAARHGLVGPVRLLLKPFTPDSLLDAVHGALSETVLEQLR